MTIEERLENVERELKQVKRRGRFLIGAVVMLAAGLAFVAGLKAAAARAVAPEIHARSISLEDENGTVRVSLKGDAEMPGLWLLDAKGEPRASLSADEYGPRLSLASGKDRPNVVLAANDTTAGLSLWDAQEETLAALSVNKNGPGLSLTYKSGQPGVWLYSGETGPGLNLNDPSGLPRAGVSVNKLGPALVLKDDKGTPRLRLGRAEIRTQDGRKTEYPESSLMLFGPEGKVLWSAAKEPEPKKPA